MGPIDAMLLGTWSSDLGGEETTGEETTLEFKQGGRLEYTIHDEDKDQKIFLTYRVEGDTLVTDQPSRPREERTRVLFTEDGKLVLIHGGARTVYSRV